MCPAAPVTKSAPSHGAQNAAVSSPPASALIASSAGLRFGSTGARFIQAKFTPRKAIHKHEVSGQWSERKSLPDTHTKQTASWTKDRLQRCAACQLKWWIDFCPVSRHRSSGSDGSGMESCHLGMGGPRPVNRRLKISTFVGPGPMRCQSVPGLYFDALGHIPRPNRLRGLIARSGVGNP